MLPQVLRAGQWFLRSDIQQPNGGVARYRRADLGRNNPVSTEITGYAISTLVYLHSLSHDEEYLERAVAGARFLAREAWNGGIMPFEVAPSEFSYFFDCGIIVRGLLAAWRASGEDEFLDVAAGVGRSMARDFAVGNGEFHPILALPDRTPVDRDPLRWSRSTGCYQLKAAMAWRDMAEATGDSSLETPYWQVLESSLKSYAQFLPGHPEPRRVMDRLHAFLYFLEGLLPVAGDARCSAALCHGIRRTAEYVRAIAPEFARSDVYAQLLRVRIYADAVGAAPLDRTAAEEEAAQLESFQAENGCFWFGREDGVVLPFENPVSTGFALQALALWNDCRAGMAPPNRHLLI